jgi:hypothetical protein
LSNIGNLISYFQNWHLKNILIYIPVTDHPDGSFPFRTGISAVRMALADIIKKAKRKSTSSSSLARTTKRSRKQTKS